MDLVQRKEQHQLIKQLVDRLSGFLDYVTVTDLIPGIMNCIQELSGALLRYRGMCPERKDQKLDSCFYHYKKKWRDQQQICRCSYDFVIESINLIDILSGNIELEGV